MKTSVSVVRCKNYKEPEVKEAVQESLKLIGGLGKIIKPGNTVLLKINLLAPTELKRAVITHPSIVKAVIKEVRNAGGKPIVADTPGFVFAGDKNGTMIKSGIKAIADELGVEALQFETMDAAFIKTEVPKGVWLKTIYAARLALEADVIISLPKLKTHSNTWYTGAIKNMFGATATRTRKLAHCVGTYEKFSGAIVDIFSVLKPQLSIMDAVVGMEGEGPRYGDPKHVGLILASYDSVALDAAASKIIGYEPMEIYTTKLATDRGLGNGNLHEIEILGERIDNVSIDFKKPSGRRINLPSFLAKLGNRFLKVEPWLLQNKCEKCAICAKSCPVDAIKMNPYPVIDRESCIECYCCNELCPEAAMEIRKNWLAKLMAG